MGTANATYEESWTVEHLLAHCEGYRVESPEGELGYVEEVVEAPDRGAPLALRVRIGCSDLIEIVVEDVVELRPQGERILIRALADARPIREPLILAG